jgi:pyruvate kinase
VTDIVVTVAYGDLVVEIGVEDVGGYSGEVVADCGSRAVKTLTHALAAMHALSQPEEHGSAE